ARPSWSVSPATTSSTPTPSRTRRRSLESHMLGNGPVWFGGGPHGKGVSPRETTSPCGLSCDQHRRVGAGDGLPVVAERDDLAVLGGFGDVGVGVDQVVSAQVVSAAVLGEE